MRVICLRNIASDSILPSVAASPLARRVCFERGQVDQRFLALRGNGETEPFESAEVAPAPPKIRRGYILRTKNKPVEPNHRHVFCGAALQMHRMAKQEADYPRVDVSASRLSKQQKPARFEHAIKLPQGHLLSRQMVQGLVAEHQIYAPIRQVEFRNITMTEFDGNIFLCRLNPGSLKAFPFGIHADHPLGSEMIDQQPEGLALAASGVEDNRVRWLAFRNQPFQIVQCRGKHMPGPGLGAEKPKPNASFGHEGRVARGVRPRYAPIGETRWNYRILSGVHLQ